MFISWRVSIYFWRVKVITLSSSFDFSIKRRARLLKLTPFWHPRIRATCYLQTAAVVCFINHSEGAWIHFPVVLERKTLKSVFDLHFKLKSRISTFNRDVTIPHLNIPCDSYMTFLPQIPNISPRGATTPLRHWSTRRLPALVSCPTSYFLHVSIVYNLILCVLFMGCLVTFLLKGLWEFHYRSLFNFSADLHAPLDTHKESRGAGSGDELFGVREGGEEFYCFFFSFFFPPAWQQSATNLAHVDEVFTMHMQCTAVHWTSLFTGKESLVGFINAHANWRAL